MKKVKGIKKYARQLIKSLDINEVPAAIDQLTAIANLMDKDRNLRTLLTSPLFKKEEKQKAVQFLSKKVNMSEKTSKFLDYLAASGVIVALSAIISALQTIYFEMKHKAKAVVSAASEISADNRQKLAESLKKVTGKDIEVSFLIDPSLLGGVSIRVGSTLYDSSIKGQLGLLRDKLIKG